MNLISTENIGKSQGAILLFEGVSLGIETEEKIALIGTNGSGKSSLFRLLANLDNDFEGNITRNKELKISYLKQINDYNPEHTILQYLLSEDSPVTRLLTEYEETLLDIEEKNDDKSHEKLALLMDQIDRVDGWNYEKRFKRILNDLAIKNIKTKMKELSGGMGKKVELAHALIQDSNLLLLDEPTNHLDIETIVWLQNYLQEVKKAVILITHDRYFMDEICETIYEIEDKQLYRYDGNYSSYMEQKMAREKSAQQKQSRLNNILRNELVWLSRGAKARTTKQKARIDRIDDIKDEITTEKAESASFFTNARRMGNKILEIENISKAYGELQVIDNFSRVFQKQERIGLIGANGSGKSTLLRLIMKLDTPDSGTIDPGDNTYFGFFDQLSSTMNPDVKVLDYLKMEAEQIRLEDGSMVSAAKLLEEFLFPKEAFYKEIGVLSGGEKRRLYLIKILLQNPNFLLFDEPTNDFDIQTLSILENFLINFPGCLIVVSHDRYFLDRVVNRLLVLKDNKIVEFPGNYSDYKKFLRKEAKNKKKELTKKIAPKKSKPKAKFSYKEKIEYENILDDIDKLEVKKADLEKALSGGEKDPIKLEKAAADFEELGHQIEAKIKRWAELSERAGE